MAYKHFIPLTWLTQVPGFSREDVEQQKFVCHKSLAKLLEKFERNYELAIHWLEENYANLNTGKSHLLIFGHIQEHHWTQIGKDIIWQENKVKFLGKTIDNYYLIVIF